MASLRPHFSGGLQEDDVPPPRICSDGELTCPSEKGRNETLSEKALRKKDALTPADTKQNMDVQQPNQMEEPAMRDQFAKERSRGLGEKLSKGVRFAGASGKMQESVFRQKDGKKRDRHTGLLEGNPH